MDEFLERELIKVEEMMGFYASRLVERPLVPPEHVYFSLTNRCCLRCIMCDIPKSSGRPEEEMSTEEIKKILLQIKELDVKHLIFSGGEPLLRDDLAELVRFSKKIGIRWVDIITNGILFDDKITRELIDAGLNHITVSLDGVSDVHNAIRGKGAFQKSAETIDKLNDYKQKYNLLFPTLGINFTIINKNIGDILKIVEFAKSKKCNTVVFQPVLVDNTSMDERKVSQLWPSGEELTELKGKIRLLLSSKKKEKDIWIYTDNSILKNIVRYFQGERPAENFKCYELIKRVVITCNGDVWSCKGTYGNLKVMNLKQIWLSEKAQKIREAVSQCQSHCLQDCVFFPMDISGQIKLLFSKIKKRSDVILARRRLRSRADYCISRLLEGLELGFSDVFNPKKLAVYKLWILKKRFLKQ